MFTSPKGKILYERALRKANKKEIGVCAECKSWDNMNCEKNPEDILCFESDFSCDEWEGK